MQLLNIVKVKKQTARHPGGKLIPTGSLACSFRASEKLCIFLFCMRAIYARSIHAAQIQFGQVNIFFRAPND